MTGENLRMAPQPAQDEDARLRATLSHIGRKILVMSGKGGVGKSTVAANLAATLAGKGNKVGLLDVDIHGPNIPKMLGIEDARLETNEEGMVPVKVTDNLSVMSMAFLLKDRDVPVIWRGPMKMGAIRQFIEDVAWGELDYLIIDLPPGTGDEPLSVAQLIPGSDGAVIVTTPQDVALLDSRKSISFARALKMPVIGVIENMSGFACPHCGKVTDLFKSGGGEKAAGEMGVPFLGRIPIEPGIVIGGDEGTPFSSTDSKSAEAFRQIVENIVRNIGGTKS